MKLEKTLPLEAHNQGTVALNNLIEGMTDREIQESILLTNLRQLRVSEQTKIKVNFMFWYFVLQALVILYFTFKK